ncbi:Retrovirus-related Pol polyprotein from transposon RE1 [Bienertia sinuspersici]
MFYFLSLSSDDWTINSGATDHMCHDLKYFYSCENIENQRDYITIPDGTRVLVKYKELIKLGIEIVLKDVLHVPNFKFNLISVPKLCKDIGCLAYFYGETCYD